MISSRRGPWRRTGARRHVVGGRRRRHPASRTASSDSTSTRLSRRPSAWSNRRRRRCCCWRSAGCSTSCRPARGRSSMQGRAGRPGCPEMALVTRLADLGVVGVHDVTVTIWSGAGCASSIALDLLDQWRHPGYGCACGMSMLTSALRTSARLRVAQQRHRAQADLVDQGADRTAGSASREKSSVEARGGHTTGDVIAVRCCGPGSIRQWSRRWCHPGRGAATDANAFSLTLTSTPPMALTRAAKPEVDHGLSIRQTGISPMTSRVERNPGSSRPGKVGGVLLGEVKWRSSGIDRRCRSHGDRAWTAGSTRGSERVRGCEDPDQHGVPGPRVDAGDHHRVRRTDPSAPASEPMSNTMTRGTVFHGSSCPTAGMPAVAVRT